MIAGPGWRAGLLDATTIEAVVDVVQRVVWAHRARLPSTASGWRPQMIHSREDVEHWARRLPARPRLGTGDHALDGLAALMQSAVERMNELGPRRIAETSPAAGT